MTMLWGGGEDFDFPNGNVPYIKTAAGYYNSDYARCSLGITWPTVSPGTRSKAFDGGAVTTCWFHFRLYHNDYGAHTALRFAGLGKTGTSSGLWVGNASNVNKLRLSKYDGTTSTTLADESGTSLLPDGLFTIDVQVTSFGASANVKVFVNGGTTAVIDYTGDVTLSDMTDIDCVIIQGTSDYDQALLSELIVADEDTRASCLLAQIPNAAGDDTDWSGAYTDIDEVTKSNADKVYTDDETSSGGGMDFQCGLSNTPTGSFTCKGIRVAAEAVKSAGASVGTLQLGVKSGGTVDVDAGQALSQTWTQYQRMMSTINGSAITKSVLDALQLNLRSEI